MLKLGSFFQQQRQITLQQREIAQLRSELETLRRQNTSMREGMRRCTSCEYRIEFKKRQGDRN